MPAVSDIQYRGVIVGPSVTAICVAALDLLSAAGASVSFGERVRFVDPAAAAEYLLQRPDADESGPGDPTSTLTITSREEAVEVMVTNPNSKLFDLHALAKRLGCAAIIRLLNSTALPNGSSYVFAEEEACVFPDDTTWSFRREVSGAWEVRCDALDLVIGGGREDSIDRVDTARAKFRAATLTRFGHVAELVWKRWDEESAWLEASRASASAADTSGEASAPADDDIPF